MVLLCINFPTNDLLKTLNGSMPPKSFKGSSKAGQQPGGQGGELFGQPAGQLNRDGGGGEQGCQVWPFRGKKNKFDLFLIGWPRNF